MLGVFALTGMIIRNSVVMAPIRECEEEGMQRYEAIVGATTTLPE